MNYDIAFEIGYKPLDKVPPRGNLLDRNQEKTVTRTVSFKTAEHGYKTDVVEVTCQELFIPVSAGGETAVIQVLQNPVYDGRTINESLGSSPELDDQDGVTIVHLGGAGGAATSHVGDELVRVCEAAKKTGLKVSNIIVLSHPSNAPRTTSPQTHFDKGSARNSAEMIEQVLADPEIKIKGKLVLSGLSHGGMVMTEAAALMGTRVEAVILMDPGGMGRHKNIIYKLLKNSTVDAYRRFRQQGMSRKDAIAKTWEENAVGSGSRKGIPKNVPQMIPIYMGVDHVSTQVRESYSLGKPGSAISSPTELIGNDTTKLARESIRHPHVVFAVAMASDVVPSIQQRNPDWEKEMLETIALEADPTKRKEIEQQAQTTLESMFPNIPPNRVALIPWWKNTHGSIADQGVMDLCLASLKDLLYGK